MNPVPSSVDHLLFFGSFDPFTIGHAQVVTQGLELIHPIKGVDIIPAWNAIWQKQLSPFAHRLNMIKLALKAMPTWNGNVHVQTIEQEKQFSGATLQTVQEYQRQYPRESLGLLMGSDSILTFQRWYEWKQLLAITPIWVVIRDDEPIEQIKERMNPELRTFVGSRIVLLPSSGSEAERHASSTGARAQIQVNGQTTQVLPVIQEYIHHYHLYS